MVAARERPEPRHARVLRLGVRGGDLRGPGVVAEPGPAVSARRHDHAPGPSPRGLRRAGLALGARQSRLGLSRDPDQRRRALRDPRAGPRAPSQRELLHALGREHEHGRRARRQAARADADRRFTITVDGEPAGGRPNHVRSSPAAHEFYIRDVLLDWERDRVNELSIERLGPPPPRPPFGKRSNSNGRPRTCGSG